MAKTTSKAANHWSETRVATIIRPMQEFIHQSTSSGIVLIVAAVVALLWANSPWSGFYVGLLESYAAITIGPFELRESLLHWINDGLMVIFFFLVGLEIKRELLVGELSNIRAALLPIAAAAGGAVVPAVIYSALNLGGPGSAGWAIPMATDIAFALGVLSLLGSRVPFGLKVFLTAVAIVDDLIAVLMIALFYAGELNLLALAIGFGVLMLLVLANTAGFRSPLLYALLGVVVWLAFLASGVHATIAGVLVALTVPARSRLVPADFLGQARRLLDQFSQSSLEPTRMLTEERQQAVVLEVEELCEGVQAPLQKMEHSLHPWVFFLIMPIFALANAGVAITTGAFSSETLPVVMGVSLGLVFGKPLGLLLTCWLVVRANLAVLPQGVTWTQMAGVGLLAGIGFTMSLFITSLAFEGAPAMLDAAKIGILLASVVAGALGFFWLSRSSEQLNAPLANEVEIAEAG